MKTNIFKKLALLLFCASFFNSNLLQANVTSSSNMTFNLSLIQDTGGFNCPDYIPLDTGFVVPISITECRSQCSYNAQSGFQAGINTFTDDLWGCLVEVEMSLINAWGGYVNPFTHEISNFPTVYDLITNTLPEAYACIDEANTYFESGLDDTSNMWIMCDAYCECF